MSKELEKELNNLHNNYDPYFSDWDQELAFEYGWNAARDKIIEILKKNIKIQPGGLNCNMINKSIIWEIERL